MGRRRLTILTEYFHPEESATAQLLTDLATALTDRYDVAAITSRPNYHPEDTNVSVPTREDHEGVTIRRVLSTRFQKDSLPLRAVNWLTYCLSATGRLLQSDSDVVLVVSNPPILPLAAWVNKRVHGTRYVYLIHDVYPDMAVELGMLSPDGIVTRAWDRLMGLFYRDADRIVVLGDSMRRHLEEKFADDPSVDPDDIEVIPNWADGEFVEPRPKAENEFARSHGTVDPFTLVYSGNVGRFHELETAIEAVARLGDEGRDIQLLVIGEGARKAELREAVRNRGIDNVRFLPFQPYDRLPESLTCGDASLVGIKSEMEGLCVSSKLYSSLAAGRPVLAVVGEDDEVARVVETDECGAHVTPGDVDTAAAVLRRWMDDPALRERLGASARRCFEDSYTLDRAVREYEDVLAELLGE